MKKFFLFCAFILTSALFAFSQTPHAQQSADIAPFGNELFKIHGNLGSATAKVRAEIIEQNITELAEDFLFSPQNLKIEADDNSHDIIYGDKVIIAITARQAEAEGKARAELAKDYLNIILTAVEKEKSKDKNKTLAEEIIFALLILFAAFTAVLLIHKAHIKIHNILAAKKANKDNFLNNIIDINTQKNAALFALKIVKFILLLLIIYFAAMALLEIFPQTRHFAEVSFHSLLVPVKKGCHAFYHYIPHILDILFILLVFILLNKLFRKTALKVSQGKIKIIGFHPDWALPTYQIIRVILIVFAFIFLFPHLPGSESPGFKGVSVFIGILLSLGSTSLISNLMSGLVITYMRPFKVGEFVKMGDVTGKVVEKNALVTRVQTYKNEIVTIPNSSVMTTQTINYSNSAKEHGLILHADVTVGYDIDWRKAHKLLLEAAANTPDILKDPAPFVLQTALDNFAVRYEINAYIDNPVKIPKNYSAIYANILDIFNRENIEIMTPQITLRRDKTAAAIPPEYLKKSNKD